MRWVDAVAQCVADFVVDARCHACGAGITDTGGGAPALARPVPLGVRGVIRIESRVLCAACAASVRAWVDPVVIGGPDAFSAGPVTVYPAFETDERLLALVHLMKFARRRPLAPWLAAAMADALPARALESPPAPAVVVAVPMDRRARMRRGFNQAGCMARELARRWEVPLADGIRKRRPTRAQSLLGRDARWRNLEGAFTPGPEPVRDRMVILVDDLVTTGATVCNCEAVLRGAGAAAVRVVCAGYRPPSAHGFSSILTTTSERG